MSTVGNGQARRRERTRQALLGAAAEMSAEGRSHASIEEITRRAGVGFGSFYNHFDSRETLFAEAVFAVLDRYVEWLGAALTERDDPARAFARSFRLTGRLAASQPGLLAPVLNAGLDVLFADRALRRAALADIRAGIAAGRFVDEDPEVLVVAVGSALLGLLRLVTAQPERDAARATDVMTVRLLCLLGLSAAEAESIGVESLPDLPAFEQWTHSVGGGSAQ